MRFIILYIVLSLLLFSGCEKTEVIDIDVEYEEYIVVQAELKSDSLVKGVSFTRTLPPAVEYNILDAELKDVIAYIKINGVQVIPLHYTSKGIYKPLYEFRVIPGNTYELFGERGDAAFYSITRAPMQPAAGTPTYSSHTNSFDIPVSHNSNEIYGAVWIIGNYQDMSFNYSSLSSPDEKKSNIVISTSVLPEKYRTSEYASMRYVKVFSYDAAFFDFYNSIKNNEPVNNAFIQGSGSTVWNVKGTKAIGLFIGVAEGSKVFVN